MVIYFVMKSREGWTFGARPATVTSFERGPEAMAVKKKAASKSGGASASRKAAPKKAAKKRATRATSVKAGGSKAGASKAKAAKKASAAAVKLTDRQHDLLRAIHGTREAGYLAQKKGEAKTLEALATRKLIRRGAKDKTSGHVRYHVSKAGEKHVGSSNPTA